MSDDPLISILVEEWLTYLYYRKRRSSTTIDTYRSSLSFFIKFTEDCTLSNLTVEVVDKYASYLLKLNLAPKTYRNRLVPIRSFFHYLFLKDYTNIHPEKIETPPDVADEANFLLEHEQDMMLSACKDARERALVLFLVNTGLRVSELVNLHNEDIYKRSVLVRAGKGRKARVTFFNSATEEALLEYQASIPPCMFAFPNKNGNKLSRQFVTRRISDIAERAGITKNVSAHTMRHTFGTMMLTKGASIEEVQQMLGHANIRTTLIYLHFTNEYLHQRYDEVNGMNEKSKTEILLSQKQIRQIKTSKSVSLVLT